MKLLATLLLAFTLTGCATKPTWQPAPDVVVKQEYIIRIPPAETMTLPTPVPHIDVTKSDQGDVARWLLKKEEYTISLENKLKAVAKFFVEEQKKLEK